MSNTDLTTRYARIRAVLHHKELGDSQSATAAALNLSIGTVKRYWSATLPAVNPAHIIDSALQLKGETRYRHYGALQLAAELGDGIGMGRGVSERTITRAIHDAGLAVPGERWRNGSRPYWMDAKPSYPKHTYQFDTVKLRTRDGILHEIFSIADAYSALHDLSFVQGNNLAGCLLTAFDRMGVPERLNGDNGFGMICQANGRHSVFQNLAAYKGVQAIHYIPEGDPNKNAAVESFHRWIQMEHEAFGRCADYEDLAAFLTDRLYFWNMKKWCTSLGGMKARKTPNDVHPYVPGPVGTPAQVLSDVLATTTVSFTRRIDKRGMFVVRHPGLVVYLGEDLMGHNCRCDIAPDGSARFLVRFPAKKGEGVHTERVCGRIITDYDGEHTHVVATCQLDWSLNGDTKRRWFFRADRLEIDHEIKPINTDWAALERHYMKSLKQARPTVYPGYLLFAETSEGWTLTDKRTKEVVLSHMCVPDHAREL